VSTELKKNPWRESAVTFLGAAMVFALSIWFRSRSWESIENGLHVVPLKCPLKSFTGLSCAFCGMTHAWIALLRGEFQKSFQFNALGMPLVGVCVFLFIAAFWLKKPISEIFPRRAVWAFVGIAVIYAVARNLPLNL
jgi:hypothetical protein